MQDSSTNRYTDFMRDEPTVAAVLESASDIVLPFIVIAELRGGFAAGTRAGTNEAKLKEFLHQRDVTILFADGETIEHYAALFGELSRGGRLIPINDLWIAALVVQHHLTLCSRDGHFDHLPQIPRA